VASSSRELAPLGNSRVSAKKPAVPARQSPAVRWGQLFVTDLLALLLMLGIPQIVIGYMLVFLGTGTPELFVSLISTIQVNLGVAGTDDLTVSIVMESTS
jgi:hypothetical protein